MSHTERDHSIRYEPDPDVVSEASGERMVILAPDGTELNTINAVGAMVWRQLPATFTQIVSGLEEQYPNVEATVLERDVDRFLDEMLSHRLIVAVHAAS